jgi:hypothetical protein
MDGWMDEQISGLLLDRENREMIADTFKMAAGGGQRRGL